MSSSLLTSVGVRLQRLLTSVAHKQLGLKTTSFVVSSCRYQSTNVDEDDQVVVVDSKRLNATSKLYADDHVDRHVRSSGTIILYLYIYQLRSSFSTCTIHVYGPCEEVIVSVGFDLYISTLKSE